jgi:hypothetical protein
MRMVACLIVAATLLTGCDGAYYAAAEQLGYAKRDILADRVEEARDSQEEAKQEITDALTAFGSVVSYDGGELEAQYRFLATKLQSGEQAAESVGARVRDVENVALALFEEWQGELAEYSNPALRAKSEEQLATTFGRYEEMMVAMKRAESRMDPALQPLRDQVLFLKHNLNARAVAGVQNEIVLVDAQVEELIADLDAAIEAANRFIAALEQGVE